MSGSSTASTKTVEKIVSNKNKIPIFSFSYFSLVQVMEGNNTWLGEVQGAKYVTFEGRSRSRRQKTTWLQNKSW